MTGTRARIAPVADRSALRSVLMLSAFLAVSFSAAAIGSMISAPAIDGWYADAPKPMWTPPNAVFGPVWAVLYALISVAGWLVWRHRASPERFAALSAYVVQLALNVAWTPAFFGLGAILGTAGLWIALGIIVALDFAVLVAIIRFGEVSRPAAALLVPYWLWVLFATTLNAAIAVLYS